MLVPFIEGVIESLYIGPLKNGKAHTNVIGDTGVQNPEKGIMIFDKGQARYEGMWENGRNWGMGKYVHINGSSYEGGW